MRIFTIGHSTRSAAEFIAILQAHGVQCIVDVRRYPGSKRHPQFSQEALRALLTSHGIGYRHEPDLGGRRGNAAANSPNAAWRSASFRAYADHMGTPEFAAAVERVLADAGRMSSALMCAEAVPWRCHRQLIADLLVAGGHDVLNLLSMDRADPHRLNPAARRAPDGTLTYPPAGGEQTGLFDG